MNAQTKRKAVETHVLLTDPLLRLPEGTEEKAWELGAVQRQLRKFDGPLDVLRSILLMVSQNMTLRGAMVGRAFIKGPGPSHVSLYKLMVKSSRWLEWIVGQLCRQVVAEGTIGKSRSIRAIDATTIYHKGSDTLLRLHTKFDVGIEAPASFELTSKKVGESLKRYDIQQGEILLLDRGYFKHSGLVHAIDHGADVIVRALSTIQPQTKDGKEVSWMKLAKKCENPGDFMESEAYLYANNSGRTLQGRLIVLRVSEEVAKEELAYRKNEARKGGFGLSERSKQSCRFILLWTSLGKEEFSAKEILDLYRSRWQIELLFKRMKSLLDLEKIPSKNPETIRSWIAANLVSLMLLEDLAKIAGDSFIQEDDLRLCS